MCSRKSPGVVSPKSGARGLGTIGRSRFTLEAFIQTQHTALPHSASLELFRLISRWHNEVTVRIRQLCGGNVLTLDTGGTSLIQNTSPPQGHHRALLDSPTVGSWEGAVSNERGTAVLVSPNRLRLVWD